MKKLIFTLAVVLSATTLFSQNNAEAKKILDKAYSAYENAKGVKMTFEVTSIEANGKRHPSQKGTVMAKKNKFKVELPGIITCFDGKTQWVFMAEQNEVNVSNPTAEELAAISPLTLLSIYKNGYNLKSPVNKTVNGKNAAIIGMTPSGNKSDFKEVSVAIDKKSNAIVQVVLTMKDDVKNKIDVVSYNTNYNFADTEFVFDKAAHKGVEVIDLR